MSLWHTLDGDVRRGASQVLSRAEHLIGFVRALRPTLVSAWTGGTPGALGTDALHGSSRQKGSGKNHLHSRF